jgi:hypothetical protein
MLVQNFSGTFRTLITFYTNLTPFLYEVSCMKLEDKRSIYRNSWRLELIVNSFNIRDTFHKLWQNLEC